MKAVLDFTDHGVRLLAQGPAPISTFAQLWGRR